MGRQKSLRQRSSTVEAVPLVASNNLKCKKMYRSNLTVGAENWSFAQLSSDRYILFRYSQESAQGFSGGHDTLAKPKMDLNWHTEPNLTFTLACSVLWKHIPVH